MVFVHSRKDTGKTARTLVAKAQNNGDTAAFDCTEADQYPYMAKDIHRSRNRYLPRRKCAWHARLHVRSTTCTRDALPLGKGNTLSTCHPEGGYTAVC